MNHKREETKAHIKDLLDTIKRNDILVQICQRAEELGLAIQKDRNKSYDDVEAAANYFNMDLIAWLDAGNREFADDFYGIRRHIIRHEDPMDNPEIEFGSYVPHFAAKDWHW